MAAAAAVQGDELIRGWGGTKDGLYPCNTFLYHQLP